MHIKNITNVISIVLVVGIALVPTTMVASDKKHGKQMFEAVQEGDLAALEALFNTKKPKIDWREEEDGNTIFHALLTIKNYKPLPQGEKALKVVEEKYQQIIELLVKKAIEQKKLNVFTLANIDGDAPLHLALSQEQMPTGFIIKTFLSTVQKLVSQEAVHKILLTPNKDKEMPLQIAVESGSVSGLREMLAYNIIKAKVTQPLGDHTRGQNILHIAGRYNGHRIVNALLPSLPQQPTDGSELSPGQPLQPIIDGFVDDLKKIVNCVDQDGKTPLMCAAEEANYGVISALLRIDGIDVIKKDHQGRTAFETLYDLYAEAWLECLKVFQLVNQLPFDINMLRFGIPGFLVAGGSLAFTYVGTKMVESYHEHASPEVTKPESETVSTSPQLSPQEAEKAKEEAERKKKRIKFLPGIDADKLRRGMEALRTMKKDESVRKIKGFKSHATVKDRLIHLLAQASVKEAGRYTLTLGDIEAMMSGKSDPRYSLEFKEVGRINGGGLQPMLKKDRRLFTQPFSNGLTPLQNAVALNDSGLIASLLREATPADLRKMLTTRYPLQANIVFTSAGKLFMGVTGLPFKGFVTQAFDVMEGLEGILMLPQGLTPFQFAIAKGLEMSAPTMILSGKLEEEDYKQKFPANVTRFYSRYSGKTPVGALLEDLNVVAIKYPQARFVSYIQKANILMQLLTVDKVEIEQADLRTIIMILRNGRQSNPNVLPFLKLEEIRLKVLAAILDKLNRTKLEEFLSNITEGKKTILHLAAEVYNGCPETKIAHDNFIEILKTLPGFNTWILSKDEGGNLPVHLACNTGGNNALINDLLTLVPETLKEQNTKGDTPLHKIVQIEDSWALHQMLSLSRAGAIPVLAIKNKAGKMPLACASRMSDCWHVLTGFQNYDRDKLTIKQIDAALKKPLPDKTLASTLTNYFKRLCMVYTGIVLDDKGQRLEGYFQYDPRFLWDDNLERWKGFKAILDRDCENLKTAFITEKIEAQMPLVKAYVNGLQKVIDQSYKDDQQKINHYSAVFKALEPLREIKWKDSKLTKSYEYGKMRSLLTTTHEFLAKFYSTKDDQKGTAIENFDYKQGEISIVDDMRENILKNQYFQGTVASIAALILSAYAYSKRKAIKRFLGIYKKLSQGEEDKLVRHLGNIILSFDKMNSNMDKKAKQKRYKTLEELYLSEYQPHVVKRIKKSIAEYVKKERAQQQALQEEASASQQAGDSPSTPTAANVP